MPRIISLMNALTSGIPNALSESRKQDVAKGFLLICAANFFTKVADLLANPKITLTWLMQSLGAPGLTISLLVPIRESGSMLPQLFLAGLVSRFRRKVLLYQIGAAVAACSVLGMVPVYLFLNGAVAGWFIVILLTVFSLGRCLCSLVFKAVLGKVIPQTLRGQTNGWSAMVAGLTSCAVAVLLLTLSALKSGSTTILLLVIAATSWLLACLVYGLITESDDDMDYDDKNGLMNRLQLLRADADLSLFIVVRTLMMSSALVAPYYILLNDTSTTAISVLGGLLLASGLAQLLSSVVWGRWSDHSSRGTLFISGALVCSLGVLAVTLHVFQPDLFKTRWLVPLMYFCLEIAHQGVRVSRKTYIIDLADDHNRVDYVALSNSVIGILLLTTGVLLGLLSSILQPIWIIAGLSAASFAGAMLSLRMKDA